MLSSLLPLLSPLLLLSSFPLSSLGSAASILVLANTLDGIEVPNTIISAAAMTAIVSNSLLSDIARFPFTYLLSGRTKTSITMHSEIAYSESYYLNIKKILVVSSRL